MILAIVTTGMTPIVWQDEGQIIGLYETYLNPHSEVSAVARPDTKKGHHLFSILGPAASHWAHTTFPGVFGHRYLQILFALIGGGIVAILVRKRLGVTTALVLATIWFTEPSLVQSFRGGRVDVMAMSFVLAGLAVLVNRWPSGRKGGIELLKWVLAGVFFALSFLSWISSVLCFPAFVLVLVHQWEGWGHALMKTVSFALGSVLVISTFCAIDLHFFLVSFRETFMDAMTTSNGASSLSADKILSSIKLSSPILIYLAYGMIKWDRGGSIRLASVICLVVSFILAVRLRIYIHRFIYLLPLCFLIIAFMPKPRKNLVQTRLLMAVLLVQFSFSTIARNSIGFIYSEQRDYNTVFKLLEGLGVQKGDVIYDQSYQTLLAQKHLGFHLSKVWDSDFGLGNNPIVLEADWVIATRLPDSLTLSRMKSESFVEIDVVDDQSSEYGSWYVWERNHSVSID